MTGQDAISIFEKDYMVNEQLDMEKDIQDIGVILNQRNVDRGLVIKKIENVNEKHPENVLIHDLIFQPQRTSIPLSMISDQDFIADLKWKQIYLKAKKCGKLFEDFCKEIKTKCGEICNG